jgi:YidC/Oxa1 family membrane protein insertase
MDTQRIIAFIVFSFSLLLLWESWQNYSNPKPAVTVSAKKEGLPATADGASLPQPGQALSPAAPAAETGQVSARRPRAGDHRCADRGDRRQWW